MDISLPTAIGFAVVLGTVGGTYADNQSDIAVLQAQTEKIEPGLKTLNEMKVTLGRIDERVKILGEM